MRKTEAVIMEFVYCQLLNSKKPETFQIDKWEGVAPNFNSI